MVGKNWLRKEASKPTAAQTINFAPVFRDFGNASMNLNCDPNKPNNDDHDDDNSNDDDNREDHDDDNGKDDYDDDNGEDDDGTEDRDDDNYVDEPASPNSAPSTTALMAFTKTYNLQTHRWRLSSGRDVESILYKKCCLMDSQTFAVSLAASFTVDLGDPLMKAWFHKEEWEEIRQSVPPLPINAPEIVAMFRSLRRFDDCTTTDDIHKVLAKTHYLNPDETYVRTRDYHSMWADLVVRNLYLSPPPLGFVLY